MVTWWPFLLKYCLSHNPMKPLPLEIRIHQNALGHWNQNRQMAMILWTTALRLHLLSTFPFGNDYLLYSPFYLLRSRNTWKSFKPPSTQDPPRHHFFAAFWGPTDQGRRRVRSTRTRWAASWNWFDMCKTLAVSWLENKHPASFANKKMRWCVFFEPFFFGCQKPFSVYCGYVGS